MSTASGEKSDQRDHTHGPDDGVDWQPPHGYSHHVAWDGEAVVKTFTAAALDRRPRELAVLRSLGESVPLARPLPGGDSASVRMTYVPGILGQQWLTASGGTEVGAHVRLMEQCGATLRRLHQVGHGRLGDEIPGEGPVVVHGDFAPYNMIVDADDGELRAVLDWELVHFGTPVEDLAWLEWYMRIWYYPRAGVLDALYAAYGRLPAWEERHEAMISRCMPHLERSRRPSFPADVAKRWALQMERTYAFEEIVEGT